MLSLHSVSGDPLGDDRAHWPRRQARERLPANDHSSTYCFPLQILPRTTPTIAFLGITVLESVVDIVIVGLLLNSFEDGFVQSVLKRDVKSVLPVYLGLFVLAHVFQLVLAIDALSAKNTIQIMGLCIFNTLFLTYACIQIVEIKSLITDNTLSVLVWFIPGMIALTELVYFCTLLPIYREFGWTVYKRIGADRAIKKMFMWYQVFICIIKFDIFLFIAFSLQLVLLVLRQSAAERWLTVAALPISLFLLGLGYASVRYEHRLLWWSFIVGALAGAAYFVWKLFRIYEFRSTDYKLIYKSLTVFAAFCLAALIWTCTTAYICYHRFGRGLKQAMARSAGTADDKLENGRYMLESANNSRMSMD
ncbi:hypothetical protein RQP46_001898 [Phenoliferia psychrophenolica]